MSILLHFTALKLNGICYPSWPSFVATAGQIAEDVFQKYFS